MGLFRLLQRLLCVFPSHRISWRRERRVSGWSQVTADMFDTSQSGAANTYDVEMVWRASVESEELVTFFIPKPFLTKRWPFPRLLKHNRVPGVFTSFNSVPEVFYHLESSRMLSRKIKMGWRTASRTDEDMLLIQEVIKWMSRLKVSLLYTLITLFYRKRKKKITHHISDLSNPGLTAEAFLARWEQYAGYFW